ncbi:hypothetical protein DFH29DRAFT_1008526 [Suillus ampliporus]|nr:hypothetical protein DFH29DRAFT_1008526 [Suillus ampliporus]
MPVMRKLTAKKSNGGSAPRVVIAPPGRNVSDASRDEEMEVVPDGFLPQQFLYRLSRRHHTAQFAVLLQRMSARDQENGPNRLAYFGFHHSNGRPVLDRFLNILGTPELSLSAEISSAPVLLIHLKIVDYDATGGSFELAYRFLEPYFPVRAGSSIVRWRLTLPQPQRPRGYQRGVQTMGLSDHTDNDNGDHSQGTEGKKKYIAAPVDNFLEIILEPWQGLIDQSSESYLWFFCCGALVNNVESFKNLQTSIIRHRLSAAVAFTAPRFQPGFTSHLLLAFCEIVLIERFTIGNSFQHMLGQSFKLGRHTDIFLMTSDKHQLTVTKYCWTHVDHRPWGHYLPLQCPGCGVANAWRSASKSRVYTFECTNGPCRRAEEEEGDEHLSGSFALAVLRQNDVRALDLCSDSPQFRQLKSFFGIVFVRISA